MRRRVVLWVVSGVVVIAVAFAIAIVLWQSSIASPGSTDPADPDRAPVPTIAAPEPAPTEAPTAVEADGTEVVVPFFAAESAALEDTTRAIDFSEIATGSALEDLTVNALSARENGLLQVGAPEIVSAVVTGVDESAAESTMTVLVCLDHSLVDVQTADGTSVKDANAPQRVASVLTLRQVGGGWLVAQRSFPEDPTC